MPRPKKVEQNYLEKIETEVESNQSKISMVLGILIVIVVGVLIFNFFNRGKQEIGPAQTTTIEQDVSPQNLPGKYTVKEEDTLFTIAQKYYQDGYKYTEIANANNLTNIDVIETGQVLEIPKLEMEKEIGTGGGDTTIWGPRLSGDTYMVVEGDWLSKIAGRAYGDIYAYDKIAKANNIPNPDHITPGMTLTIPR